MANTNFPIGYVNILRIAKAMCDKLIMGVTVDEIVSYKGKQAVIPYQKRIEVVRACRYVDVAIPQTDMNKAGAEKNYANYLFLGDVWYGTPK